MKALEKLLWWVCLWSLWLPALAGAQTLHTERLESVRDRIVLPELTAAEKQTLANQAQIFLRDLYVHRYHKPDYYPGNVDPGAAVQSIVARASEMSTQELEVALYRLFTAQRDLHLNYYFPSPYNRYTSFIPVTLARTAGRHDFFEVRISSVNQEMFTQFAPEQRVPAVGDRVLAYNGTPIAQEIAKWLPITQGANQYGGFSRAIQGMTYLAHLRREVPALNQVSLRLRAHGGDRKGEIYTITLPWLTQWTEAAPAALKRVRPSPEAVPPFKRFDLGVDELQQEFNLFLQANGLLPTSAYPSNPTSEPVLTWGRIENTDGKFGYLRLSSFSPSTSIENTIAEARRLLMNELADTDGLIFDVRNNGGGYISLADMLPQLFTPSGARVMGFRLINTDANYRIFNESELGAAYPDFRELVNAVHGTGETYTGTAQFTSDLSANLIGQVYYKPVAVLANARSYSATDLFTCSMQDNWSALVYGEDPKTGAGGANVITHSLFLAYTPTGLFEKLPGDHAMRVAWRQNLRFGPHQGQLVEDYGCSANFDASLTASDLVTGGDRQLEGLTRSLAIRSRVQKASARGEQQTGEIYLSHGTASYSISVVHTPYVAVYINDELREWLPVFASRSEKLVTYQLPSDLPSGQVARLTFVGTDPFGRALWNLKRRITLLDEKVVVGSGGLQIDFATATGLSPLTVVNQGTAPADGWNLVSPYLQLGYAPSYANNADSDAVLFLDLTGRTAATLDFGLELDTEDGWDFVEVAVTNNVGKTVLFQGTGHLDLASYSYDLSAFAGQDNVAVHFRFTSDSNTTAIGARLTGISVH